MTDGSSVSLAFRAGSLIEETPQAPLILMEGQAARVRSFRDGRRQILSLVLPGELLRPAGIAADGAELLCLANGQARALTVEELSSETYSNMLLDRLRWAENQTARIGRMTARERMVHLFLELANRTRHATALRSAIPLPLTQEMLGDLLGLTSIHVNRVLKQLRATNAFILVRRELQIIDLRALQRMVPALPQ